MQLKTDTGLAAVPGTNRDFNGRVLVLGLGNILLKDEGIGVHIVEQLQKQDLPGNVEIIDGGTSGLDILLSQEDLDKLVVIDALRAGGEPGTIYKARFKGEERDELTKIFTADKDSKISLHQVGLIEALAAAEKLNHAPREIVIIGVEPKDVVHGLELTEQVKQRVTQIINIVLEEIDDAVYED